MRTLLLILLVTLTFAIGASSQILTGCENVTAFKKSSSPDLAIVIYSKDSETVWNALRLATLAQTKGDTVVIYVLGKGVDAFMHDSSNFNIEALSTKFISNGGDIFTCATCAKLRGTEEVKSCTITSIFDLYEIVKRSKKVLTF
jgi:sulfur relay (sulfurtransferase) complex TusBCD TusD component (DsrE family)